MAPPDLTELQEFIDVCSPIVRKHLRQYHVSEMHTESILKRILPALARPTVMVWRVLTQKIPSYQEDSHTPPRRGLLSG